MAELTSVRKKNPGNTTSAVSEEFSFQSISHEFPFKSFNEGSDITLYLEDHCGSGLT